MHMGSCPACCVFPLLPYFSLCLRGSSVLFWKKSWPQLQLLFLAHLVSREGYFSAWTLSFSLGSSVFMRGCFLSLCEQRFQHLPGHLHQAWYCCHHVLVRDSGLPAVQSLWRSLPTAVFGAYWKGVLCICFFSSFESIIQLDPSFISELIMLTFWRIDFTELAFGMWPGFRKVFGNHSVKFSGGLILRMISRSGVVVTDQMFGLLLLLERYDLASFEVAVGKSKVGVLF